MTAQIRPSIVLSVELFAVDLAANMLVWNMQVLQRLPDMLQDNRNPNYIVHRLSRNFDKLTSNILHDLFVVAKNIMSYFAPAF